MKKIVSLAKAIMVFAVMVTCMQKTSAQTPSYVQSFNNYFDNNLWRYGGNVTVVIGCRQGILYSYSRGFDANTEVAVQSISKWLTSAVIMMLVEENKFSLDDKVGQYIPSWNANNKQDVTIRQVLAHTSGIVDGTAFDESSGYSLQQAVDLLATNTQLKFTPGSTFDYGSTSYKVASRVAEVVEGKLWKTIFSERVATVCGMNTSVYSPNAIDNPATGRGLKSSLSQYSNFLRMILRHGMHNTTRIMDSASVVAIEAKSSDNGASIPTTYGLGVYREQINTNGVARELMHPGVDGALAWVDRNKDYFGLIITDAGQGPTYSTSQAFRQMARDSIPNNQCGSTPPTCDFNITAGNTLSGTTLNLTSSCTGANCTGLTYAWSGPGGVSGNTSSLPITAPTAAGTYTYTITVSKSGCAQKTATTTYTVGSGSCGYVNKQTVGTWSGLNVQTRQYTVNGSAAWLIVTAIPGSSTDKHFPRGKNFADRGDISWTNGVINKTCLGGGETGYNGLVIPTGVAVPAGYSQGTETDGAVYFQQTCTPPSAPSLSASPSTITTSGGSSTLAATGCTGGTITWSHSLGSGSPKTVTPSSNTTYMATCSIGGCVSSASSVTVNVNTCTPPSAPSLSASPSTITTSGGSSTLTATGCSGGTITWSHSLGSGSPKTVTPSSNTTYTASCSIGGCTSSNASVTVNVNIPTGPFNQCLESEIMNGNGSVTSDPNASNGSTRGLENNNNHYVDYAVTNVLTAGTYYVTLRYYSSSAPTVSVQVIGGSSQTVNLANSGSWNIVWTTQTFPVNLNVGSNTIRISGTGGGSCRQDRICVSSNSGGSSTLDPESVDAINNNAAKPVSVYPNPSKGFFETAFYLEKGKKATLIISDLQGRTIHRQTFTGQGLHKEKINLANKASGTLLLQLQKENGIEVKKISIAR